MQARHPRTLLAYSAAIALAAAALAPTAVLGRGPGPGSGGCDGSCLDDQAVAQAQVRARDGSGAEAGAPVGNRNGAARQTSTQAEGPGGGQVRARAGISDDQGTTRNARRAMGQGVDVAPGQGLGGGPGQGQGQGWDPDAVRGPGSCEDCDVELGTLSETDIEGLFYMANEEKLAHDVYTYFASLYELPAFERIASSEARHQEAVRTTLERYGLEDPTAELGEGEFSDALIADLYVQLTEQGAVSLDEAISAGILVETTDMADLEARMASLEEAAPAAFTLYSNLLKASGQHLAAFERQS